MFQVTVVEKMEAPILLLNPFSDNRAVNGTTWKYTVEADKLQMTIWRIHITYCVSTATNTHSQYVTFTVFPMAERTTLSFTLNVHGLSCLVFLCFF